MGAVEIHLRGTGLFLLFCYTPERCLFQIEDGWTILSHTGEILSGSELARPYGTTSQMAWREGSLECHISLKPWSPRPCLATTPIVWIPGCEKKMKCSDGKLRHTENYVNTDECSVWQEKLGKTMKDEAHQRLGTTYGQENKPFWK